MGRAKGIVDVDVTQLGERTGKGRIVALFSGMEAHVLQQRHFARPQAGHDRLGRRTDARAAGGDRSAQQLAQTGRDGSQTQRRDDGPLGPAEMGQQHDARTGGAEGVDRRQRGANARVVRNPGAIERHIEVHAHQHPLPGYGDVADGLLVHRAPLMAKPPALFTRPGGS